VFSAIWGICFSLKANPTGMKKIAFWQSDSSVKSFGTVRGEIGQMEQQFCWEVLYNLYVLHVGA
jgi:hypothetical protein